MITREIIRAAFPVVPLDKVVEFLDHRRKPVKQSERVEGNYPYYGANGQQGTIDGYLFDEPLVLVAEDGGHFGDPDRGIAYRVNGKIWVNNHAHVLRPKACIDIGFLTRVLENYDVGPFISGSTRAKLTKAQAKRIEIPLPPLEEQKRIAGILDQAAELCRLRTHALDKLSTLGQAIFHEMFGSVHSNPHGFERVLLGDLIKVSSGQGLTAKDMISGNFPVYGGNGINGYHNEGPVGANRIVIGRVGVYCGAVHVTRQPCWVTDNALLVRQLQPCSVTYLAEALRVADLNQYAGRAAQPLISGSRIYPVEILLPPEDQQERFEEALQAISRQHYAAERASSKIGDLFTSLQHRAFRGEL